MKPNPDAVGAQIEQSRIAMEENWRQRWVQVLEKEVALKEKESSKRPPLWTTPAGLAILGGLLTLVTGIITNFVQNQNAQAAKRQELQSALIQKAIERAPDHQAAALNLRFLWQAGLIPDYAKIPEFLAQTEVYESQEVILPSKQTFGTSGIEFHEEMPRYSLSVPDLQGAKTAQRILKIAVGEINQNIHENVSPQAVTKYWAGLGFGDDAVEQNLPWSAAFISWVLKEAGDPGGLKKSARGMDLWKSAVEKGLTFQLSEKKPQPGDLVFFCRDGNVTPDVRAGQAVVSTHPGIVYEVNNTELTVISGNSGNAVRLRAYPLMELGTDPRLIGFIRLPETP